jgi:hypothetical protein
MRKAEEHKSWIAKGLGFEDILLEVLRKLARNLRIACFQADICFIKWQYREADHLPAPSCKA